MVELNYTESAESDWLVMSNSHLESGDGHLIEDKFFHRLALIQYQVLKLQEQLCMSNSI